MLWIETVGERLVNLDHVMSIDMTHNKGAQSHWSLDAIWYDGSGRTTILRGGVNQNSDFVYTAYRLLRDAIDTDLGGQIIYADTLVRRANALMKK